jgi:hypothetical protein
MCQQTKCTATGFVIAPLSSRRILTNAHAVANQVAIKIRKHGSAQRYTARVLAVGHEVSHCCFWCCFAVGAVVVVLDAVAGMEWPVWGALC